MFGIGHMPEIIMLLVVALLIFGPKKLPEIGSAFGRGIREFKDATSSLHEHHVPQIAEPAPMQAPYVASAEVVTPVERR